MEDIEFETLLWENGNDRTTDPHGVDYADHAVLMVDDVRVIELMRTTIDGWSVFEVHGSDLVLSDDDIDGLNGFTRLDNALAFAQDWYRARASL
jgi:hypothetical protein